jgi:hypothetical protein
MMSVIMLNVVVLNVANNPFMLSVVMMNVASNPFMSWRLTLTQVTYLRARRADCIPSECSTTR